MLWYLLLRYVSTWNFAPFQARCCLFRIAARHSELLAFSGLLQPPGRSGAGSRSLCLHRQVPVNLLDHWGYPQREIETADLRGDFRGKPIQILRVSKDARPRRIVILLDTSGSMLETENKKWMMALQVAGDAAAFLPPDSEVALGTFAEKIEEPVDFAQGRKAGPSP
jgi:hypothetical protein